MTVQNALIPTIIATVILVAVMLWALAVVRKRKTEAPITLNPNQRYEIRPFPPYGDVFTFAEFQELLKIYNCGDDNGTGHWASADGFYFDLELNSVILVCPHEVRLGKRPESFFTHIIYYGK
jgi:hypothetical protein